MKQQDGKDLTPTEKEFCNEVERKATRRRRAADERAWSIWFGLGMFGIVGWSVAVPTLLGVVLGLWLDAHWPLGFSWTLTLLLGGLVLGCVNAWYWLSRQNASIQDRHKQDRHKKERRHEH